MEFNEKLQQLRKNKGITQQELAEKLYVSRTAVSKWESGRGYPNIESLKEISKVFSVSIDFLLSGDEVLFIAEKENRENMKNISETLWGIADLFSVLLVILPLYPDRIEGFVYSVSLSDYTQISPANLAVYCVLYAVIFLSGVAKIALRKTKAEGMKKDAEAERILNCYQHPQES